MLQNSIPGLLSTVLIKEIKDTGTFRLGMLQFRAVIWSKAYAEGLLFQCDCGRYTRIMRRNWSPYLYPLSRGKSNRLDELPYCCKHCKFDPLHKTTYRPWLIYGSTAAHPSTLIPKRDNKNYRVLMDDHSTLDRMAYPRAHWHEYIAWRSVNSYADTCERWQDNFKQFFQDMGPAPPCGRLYTRKRSKGYTPSNTYWHRPIRVVYKGNERPDAYVSKAIGVPRVYIVDCRRAGILDAEVIQRLYRAGKPVPKKGTYFSELDEFPQFYND